MSVINSQNLKQAWYYVAAYEYACACACLCSVYVLYVLCTYFNSQIECNSLCIVKAKKRTFQCYTQYEQLLDSQRLMGFLFTDIALFLCIDLAIIYSYDRSVVPMINYYIWYTDHVHG